MPSYFVIASDGSKYGPADEFVLQEWISQQRLTPTMELENVATGQRMQASTVPELRFPGIASPSTPPAPMASQPGSQPLVSPTQTASPYYRGSQYSAGPQVMPKSDRVNGITLMVIAVVFGVFGIFTLIRGFTVDTTTLPTGSSSEYIVGQGIGVTLLSVLWAAVGYGMKQSRKWAFITAIILSVLNICSVVTIYILIYSIMRLSNKTGAAPT